MAGNRRLTVAEYLGKAMELSGKTQRQIAHEVGYEKPNVVTMMKQGQTKVPLDKVPAFARACGVDPAAFLRLTMQEYWPDAWTALAGTFGEPLTENERALIALYRESAPNDDIQVDGAVASRVREALREAATRSTDESRQG